MCKERKQMWQNGNNWQIQMKVYRCTLYYSSSISVDLKCLKIKGQLGKKSVLCREFFQGLRFFNNEGLGHVTWSRALNSQEVGRRQREHELGVKEGSGSYQLQLCCRKSLQPLYIFLLSSTFYVYFNSPILLFFCPVLNIGYIGGNQLHNIHCLQHTEMGCKGIAGGMGII